MSGKVARKQVCKISIKATVDAPDIAKLAEIHESVSDAVNALAVTLGIEPTAIVWEAKPDRV